MLLLLTNTLAPSAEVVPALGLLSHHVRILPAEASVLVDAPQADVVIVDARRELAMAKSLCRVICTTGISTPLLVVVTEGGLAGLTSDWGIDDVILDTAGPAEIEARLRLVMGRTSEAAEDETGPITAGALVIDEVTYSVRLRGRLLDLTYKEFELLKYPRAAPGAGLHPVAAAPGGVGLRLLRGHPHGRRPRAAAARQARHRLRGAHRDRPQRRVPLRPRGRRLLLGDRVLT
jgi:hypothetical protein